MIISELQIIFESNAYLRPKFLLNADFQISKSIFTPCNFSQWWKGRYYYFEVPYLNFNYSFGSDLLFSITCYYTWVYIDHILTICWQTDRHIDIDNPEFYFCFKTCIDNQYALHWTPNAYRNMLMRIFTPSLYFQCVFNDFQCAFTRLICSSDNLFHFYNVYGEWGVGWGWSKIQICPLIHLYAPLWKRRGILRCTCRSVCRLVGMSVVLNLVQLITQEGFAPEASNLVGR